MKTIIAGSRTITSRKLIDAVMMNYPSPITEVVCGTAKGVDTLGEEWAHSRDIPVKYFPADWDKYGKKAGPLRNKEMAEYADAAVIIWDGQSRGTKNMINIMTKMNKPMWLVRTDE